MLIAVKRKCGGVSIMRIFKEEPTDDDIKEVIKKWESSQGLNQSKDQRKSVSWLKINEDDLPESKYFRDAWVVESNKIKTDMTKAKQIKMRKIRYARDEKLTELDKRKYGPEFDEKRQSLRDLPNNINLDDFSDEKELELFVPEVLKEALV